MGIKKFARILHPGYQKLIPEYRVEMKPRWGHGKPANHYLQKIISSGNSGYLSFLNEILKYSEKFDSIPYNEDSKAGKLFWNNKFLPGLDIVSLYTMIRNLNPSRYMEIGSGNSTLVAKKAIEDGKLQTKIISIDPFPRADIDSISDQVIRHKLEDIKDLSFVNELEENDILFIDNSHRCFPNSDVTVSFLEILPALKKGVVVQVHDVYLPFDYPQFMCDRFYSEQYVLAAFLLANPEKYKVMFPAYYCSEDKELKNVLHDFWERPALKNVERHGGSFWFKIAQ